MSLISKQIEELRAYAADRKGELAKIVSDAADTIETLSEKLSVANMERSSQYYNDGWIPVTERLPDEKDAGILKNFGTSKRSDYVLISIDVNGNQMTSIGCTYDGVWHWDKKYAFPDWEVTAWQPLPDPYEGENR